MTTKHPSRRISVACLAAAIFFTMSTNVGAIEQSPEQVTEDLVAEALANVKDHDTTLISQPINSQGTGITSLGGGTIDVPVDGNEGITFIDEDGTSINIQLPDIADAEGAEVLSDGTVVFPDEGAANSVIITDRGVQMLTTINDSDAPTRYSYDIDLQSDQHIELIDGGAVVVDEDGTAVLAAGSAWATDAEGKNIPTWYEIDGNTLTQVIDHTSIEDTVYPIVADPIWLAPWMVKCLVGIGIAGPQITAIASMGNPASILTAFGRGAFACVVGR
ncbi:hypothetical protein [Actinomyces ruminis]|uniref:hypothetical protein n=1 Tax=Actinomyces ruminis TaxID=1937003 RepID=UPI001177D5DA|nr:hypothetical protein [Actinomyces ruminis]